MTPPPWRIAPGGSEPTVKPAAKMAPAWPLTEPALGGLYEVQPGLGEGAPLDRVGGACRTSGSTAPS